MMSLCCWRRAPAQEEEEIFPPQWLQVRDSIDGARRDTLTGAVVGIGTGALVSGIYWPTYHLQVRPLQARLNELQRNVEWLHPQCNQVAEHCGRGSLPPLPLFSEASSSVTPLSVLAISTVAGTAIGMVRGLARVCQALFCPLRQKRE